MTSIVTLFCESANGRTGIPRYVQSLAKTLLQQETSTTDLRIQLSARWLHRISELDELNLAYHTNLLPGRVQSFLNRSGASDHILYGAKHLVHELNYYYPRVSKQTRVLMTVHDVGWRLSSVDYGLTREFTEKTEAGIHKAHRIVTTTHCVKNDLTRILGIDPDKITVIAPGINTVFLDREPKVAAPNLPPRYWLFVGAASPRKNLSTVVEALAGMEPAIPLVIAGPNTLYAETLKRHAQTRGVQVCHVEGSSDHQLREIYRRAEALVYPSLWEGFGFPIIEAAASGTPVITSNNTSMKEIGEGYAWLVNPESSVDIAQAMRAVQSLTVEEREELVIRGRVLAAKYSWEETARAHIALYQAELSLHRQPALV